MKIVSTIFAILLLVIGVFFTSNLKAQDTIVKTNGEIISAKISEVGTNAITYKKTDLIDGPTFVDYKTDILYVKYSNGKKQIFTKEPAATIQKPLLDTVTVKKEEPKINNTSEDGNANSSTKNRIEFMNNNYTINGQPASRKDVDRYLGKSKNPMVLIAHKTAKATKITQKIVGITSFPSTISGGIATMFTFARCWQEARTGPVTANSFLNLGLSVVGTLSLPITSKILKNKTAKLYDKVIDLYNVTN